MANGPLAPHSTRIAIVLYSFLLLQRTLIPMGSAISYRRVACSFHAYRVRTPCVPCPSSGHGCLLSPYLSVTNECTDDSKESRRNPAGFEESACHATTSVVRGYGLGKYIFTLIHDILSSIRATHERIGGRDFAPR